MKKRTKRLINFFDLNPRYTEWDKAKVVIIPACYEGTVSYSKGTKKAPYSIYSASSQVELYDLYTNKELYEVGICGLDFLKLKGSPKKVIEKIRKVVYEVLEEKKKPVLIGGEHSLSVGAIKASKEKFSGLTVLHLDAHADLRDEYQKDRYSHACVMRRVVELGINSVSVGVRSLSQEEASFIKEKKLKIFWADEYLKNKEKVEKEIVSSLGKEVYITLDIDVLDPSQLPATGTPEPGGLSYLDLVELFQKISETDKEVVGFDLVELSPIPFGTAWDFLCAKLIYQMIGWFWNKD